MSGRSTKLSNMAKCGRDKMASGLVCILDDDLIKNKYLKIFKNIKIDNKK